MNTIVITGATGYLGGAMTRYAVRQGADVLALLRRKPGVDFPARFVIPNAWDNPQLLAKAMEGRSAVIHCAGLAHNKTGDLWATNLDLSTTMAEAAKMAGISRFVLVSSASVFGESGSFSVHDDPAPTTEYGHSKCEAENACRAILIGSDTALSIVRAPMIVGPAAPGRAATLRHFAQRSLPLPFGALTAQRSYIDVDHLADLLWQEAVQHDHAPRLLHASHGPLSATDLIRYILAQDHIKPNLWPIPEFILTLLCSVPALADRIKPLIETHILEAGRKSLDPIV